jgi:hypothetical protein
MKVIAVIAAVLAMLGHAHAPASHVLLLAAVVELGAAAVLARRIVKALRRRPILRFTTMGGINA